MAGKAKSKANKLVALIMGTTLAVTIPLAGMISANAAVRTEGEKYKPDYDTLAEAVKAGKELSNEAALEGTVLLKNKDAALPMAGDEYLTVFGNGADYAKGIANGGFKVNQVTSTNVDSFTSSQKNRMKAYNDAAVILVSSSYSGEGKTSGYRTDEIEDNKWVDETPYTYGDEAGTEFTHKSNPYAKGEEKVEYKNSKQISDQTEELICFAHENFKKVIIMITADTTIEVGNLEASDKVDAILSVGNLGSAGWQGTGYGGYDVLYKLLNGEVNPSGRTYDLWAWDMTAQPTWANDGNGADTLSTTEAEASFAYGGSYVAMAYRDAEGKIVQRYDHAGSNNKSVYYSVKYEEGIYSGYRYHETAAAEAGLSAYEGYKYDQQVVYPFGYGLSYTDFHKEIVSVTGAWTETAVGSLNRNSKITVEVKVTNTGDTAGKDVVELYGHAPYYKNGIEKNEVVLVGFDKTSTLRPGQSQTLSIEVKVSDLASFDDKDLNGNGYKTWELDRVSANDTKGNALHDSKGHYEIRLQSNSHDVDDAVQLKDLTEDVILKYSSDESVKEENVLSQDNVFNMLGYDPVTGKDLVEDGKMQIMSRADFKTTFPEVEEVGDEATIENLKRSAEWFEMQEAYGTAEADAWKAYETALNITESREAELREDNSSLPWALSDSAFTELKKATGDWKQNYTDEDHDLYFSDLIGVEYTEVRFQNTDQTAEGYTSNEKLVGLTGIQAWNILLNKMTVDEMKHYISNGQYTTDKIDSIKKPATRMMDSALVVDQEQKAEGLNWGGCPHYAGTWNKDLMYRRGLISGNIALLSNAKNGMGSFTDPNELNTWYAPAMDLHRSAFTGRNSEYFSEDPFLSGTTGGLIVKGMRDRGIMCTIKHFALNECEQQREMYQTYATEQSCRELYMKQYEIAIEDYSADGIMTSYNCMGDFHSETNYAVMQQMVRDQWGFDGFITTDAVNPKSHMFTMDTYIRTGNNLLLSSFDNDETNEKTGFIAISGDYDSAAGVYKLADGTVSNTQWSVLRTSVRQLLYAEVNSSVAKNGIDVFSFKDATLTAAAQGANYSANIGLKADSATYTVSSGALPAGLSINNQGVISGTPAESGEFTFTVNFLGDGWVKKSATFKMSVASCFELDDGGVAPEAGTEYSAYIASDAVKVGDDYDEISYNDNGTLPEGLTIDELGEITGTPKTPGTYDVMITVTGSKTTQGGGGGGFPGGPGGGFPGGPGGGGSSVQKTEFTYKFTLTVGGEAAEEITLESLKAELDALAEKVNAEDLSSIKAEIASLKTKLETLEGSLGEGTDLTELNGKISALETKVAELEKNSGNDGGCGSVIGSTGVVALFGVIAVAGIALAVRGNKKKEDQ